MSRNKKAYYQKIKDRPKSEQQEELLSAKNSFNISDPVPSFAVRRKIYPKQEFSLVLGSLRGA